MPDFTQQDINLIFLYHTDTRRHTLTDLRLAYEALSKDEADLARLIQSATEKLQAMTDQACRQDRDLLRFHFHSVEDVLTRTEEPILPHLDYSSNLAEMPEVGPFITEDEIADALSSGSSMAGARITSMNLWRRKRSKSTLLICKQSRRGASY